MLLSQLTCARIKPSTGTLSIADSNNVERLGIGSTAVFSCPVTAPSIEISGSAIIGSSLLVPALYLNGTDIASLIAARQEALTPSSSLNVGSVSAASVTITGVGNVSTALGNKQATIGLRITGGQGRDGTGASLRVTGYGDAVYNTSTVLWGNSSVDLHQWELSWLTYGHYFRPNSSTAWAQTMGVSLTTGAWVHYKGLSAASDRSLKGDAQDASTNDCLNMLRAVSAKTYRRLDLPEGEGERLGFFAQDVEAACPGAWGNVVGTTQYRWSGNGNGGDVRTLDYARLVVPLWQACRAMLTRIEQLEARVAQLSA